MTPNLAVVAEDFSEPISLWPLVGLEPSPPQDSSQLPARFSCLAPYVWGKGVGNCRKWRKMASGGKQEEIARMAEGGPKNPGKGIVLSRGRVLSQGGQIMMWYPSWAKSEVGHLFLLCLKPACTQFVNHFFLTPEGKGPIRSLWSVDFAQVLVLYGYVNLGRGF